MTYDAATAPVTMPRPQELPIDVVDRLPANLRACVHDFGFSVVHAFVQAGVSNPRTIRHLVNAVFLGAREEGNRRPDRRPGSGILSAIDDVLRANGCGAHARTLVSVLRTRGVTLLEMEPTHDMIAASCSALSDKINVVSYEHKHRLRLRAALKQSDQDRWGWLDQ